MQSNLEQIKLGLEIILQEMIQVNRELNGNSITNSIRSTKEAIHEIDKAIVKNIRKGEIK